MTDTALYIAISRYIENATVEELADLVAESFTNYYSANPKDALAFVMEWNPDDTTDPRLQEENPICH